MFMGFSQKEELRQNGQMLNMESIFSAFFIFYARFLSHNKLILTSDPTRKNKNKYNNGIYGEKKIE